MNKPTKEQFWDYQRIQKEGKFNMWEVRNVCKVSHTNLTTDICLYIMDHYEELEQEYGTEPG